MRSFYLVAIAVFSCFVLSSCHPSAVLPEGDADSGIAVSVAQASLANNDIVSVLLSEGATIRILVYARSGATPDPGNDGFVTQNTYRVGSDGALISCMVNAAGAVTDVAGSNLSLTAGTYDFYAVMPAVAVDTDSGEAKIPHGMDYAASRTEAVNVTGSAQTVTLDVLERKCTKIEFKIRPTDGETFITRIDVGSAILTPLANTPQTVVVPGDIVPDAYATEVTLGSAMFKADTDILTSGEAVLLPCATGDVGLAMKVCLNGSSDAITLGPVTIEDLTLLKGYRYVFDVTLHAGRVYLTVSVKDWNPDADWTTIVGSGPICSSGWDAYGWESAAGGSLLETNGWEIIPGWGTAVGGNGPLAGIEWSISDWTTGTGQSLTAAEWKGNSTDTSAGNGADNWTDTSTDTSTGTGPDSSNGWTDNPTDTSVGSGAGNWTDNPTDTSVGSGAGNWTNTPIDMSVGNGTGNWASSSWNADMGGD